MFMSREQGDYYCTCLNASLYSEAFFPAFNFSFLGSCCPVCRQPAGPVICFKPGFGKEKGYKISLFLPHRSPSVSALFKNSINICKYINIIYINYPKTIIFIFVCLLFIQPEKLFCKAMHYFNLGQGFSWRKYHH